MDSNEEPQTLQSRGKAEVGASVSISTTRGFDERNLHSIKTFCSPDLEFHMLLCRPFWLPREFTAIIITAVYIPPQANTDQALKELYGNIREQETAHPDAAFVVTGDCNKANFRTIAPKYVQQIIITTCGDCVLDHCYSLFRDAYESPIHLSANRIILTILLLPAYRQKGLQSLFLSAPACLQAETETRSTCLQDNSMLVRQIGRYTTGLF